jgi:hypothetical protein
MNYLFFSGAVLPFVSKGWGWMFSHLLHYIRVLRKRNPQQKGLAWYDVLCRFYTSPFASHCLLHCFLNVYLFIAEVIQRSEVKQTTLHNSTLHPSGLLIYCSHVYCLQGGSASVNVVKPCKRTKTIMKQRTACDVKENFQAKGLGGGWRFLSFPRLHREFFLLFHPVIHYRLHLPLKQLD